MSIKVLVDVEVLKRLIAGHSEQLVNLKEREDIAEIEAAIARAERAR